MKAPILPLQLLLNALPAKVHSRVTATVCNHLLKGLPTAGRLRELEGKRLWLTITDTDTRLAYRFCSGKLLPDADTAPPDIHIRGDLRHFLQLARREEDPDTLFFARKLSLEGNTEDGLLVKNFLDALEFDLPAHLQAVLGPRLARPLLPIAQRMQAIIQ